MRRLPRAEFVLPIVVVIGALTLAASELMVAFEFTPPGGEALREQTNADRHSYAMLLLAIAVGVALAIAMLTASRPAAFAVAGLGAVALLLFLVLDLPDAGKVGDLTDPLRGLATAEAEPQIGFWLQAIGAATLAFAGSALATLGPDQLGAPGEAVRSRRDRRGRGEGPGEGLGGAEEGQPKRQPRPHARPVPDESQHRQH